MYLQFLNIEKMQD